MGSQRSHLVAYIIVSSLVTNEAAQNFFVHLWSFFILYVACSPSASVLLDCLSLSYGSVETLHLLSVVSAKYYYLSHQ